MKKLLALLFVFITLSSSVMAAGVNRYPTYAKAFAASKAQNLRMFIMVTSESCGPCKLMYNNVLKQLEPQLTEKFVVHYLDVDNEQTVVQQFAQAKIIGNSVPVLLISSIGGKEVINTHTGAFQTTNEFMEWFKATKWDEAPKPQEQPDFRPVPIDSTKPRVEALADAIKRQLKPEEIQKLIQLLK